MIRGSILLTKHAKPPTVSVTGGKTHGQHAANDKMTQAFPAKNLPPYEG
jgi:hypothetical protein